MKMIELPPRGKEFFDEPLKQCAVCLCVKLDFLPKSSMTTRPAVRYFVHKVCILDKSLRQPGTGSDGRTVTHICSEAYHVVLKNTP